MAETTYLRYIRQKCGITLMELEEHSSFSNQYLSALELGSSKRTAKNEEALSRAMAEVAGARKESLAGLEQTLQRYQGRLLETTEVSGDEL